MGQASRGGGGFAWWGRPSACGPVSTGPSGLAGLKSPAQAEGLGTFVPSANNRERPRRLVDSGIKLLKPLELVCGSGLRNGLMRRFRARVGFVQRLPACRVSGVSDRGPRCCLSVRKRNRLELRSMRIVRCRIELSTRIDSAQREIQDTARQFRQAGCGIRLGLSLQWRPMLRRNCRRRVRSIHGLGHSTHNALIVSAPAGLELLLRAYTLTTGQWLWRMME